VSGADKFWIGERLKAVGFEEAGKFEGGRTMYQPTQPAVDRMLTLMHARQLDCYDARSIYEALTGEELDPEDEP
jgi:hypothetical protein